MPPLSPMRAKIRLAIELAPTKGLRVETIGASVGYWVHLPNGTRIRIPGAVRLVNFINDFEPQEPLSLR